MPCSARAPEPALDVACRTLPVGSKPPSRHLFREDTRARFRPRNAHGDLPHVVLGGRPSTAVFTAPRTLNHVKLRRRSFNCSYSAAWTPCRGPIRPRGTKGASVGGGRRRRERLGDERGVKLQGTAPRPSAFQTGRGLGLSACGAADHARRPDSVCPLRAANHSRCPPTPRPHPDMALPCSAVRTDVTQRPHIGACSGQPGERWEG